MFYLDHVREDLTKHHNTTAIAQISKLASAEWRKLSAEQKQPYLLLADQDKHRYALEKTGFHGQEAFYSAEVPDHDSTPENGEDDDDDGDYEE